jgi:hypothetical protein
MKAAIKGQLFQLQERTHVILAHLAVSFFYFLFIIDHINLDNIIVHRKVHMQL